MIFVFLYSTLEEIKVRSIRPSKDEGDVEVTLTYTLNSKSCKFSKFLTARRPKELTHPPLQFVKRELQIGPIVLITYIGCKKFIWTLTDQFEAPLAGVRLNERVIIDTKLTIPKTIRKHADVGRPTTDKNGQFENVFIFQVVGRAPTNTKIIAHQTVNCAGFKGNNDITITISDITDTAPIMLK